jgi:hypothetical protein
MLPFRSVGLHSVGDIIHQSWVIVGVSRSGWGQSPNEYASMSLERRYIQTNAEYEVVDAIICLQNAKKSTLNPVSALLWRVGFAYGRWLSFEDNTGR